MVDDKTRIELLGGAAKVAELLGYDKEGGTQRVHNWIARGIPPAVKVQRPDLFMPELVAPPDHAPSEDKPTDKPADKVSKMAVRDAA